MTSETEFVALAGRVLRSIAAALDAASGDLDWSENDGVLTIECPDGSRIIVNRHVPNRELWIAARSGGQHFRLDAGAWRNTRSGEELGAALSRLVGLQAGIAIEFASLPAA